jgi:hypothetical protein
MRKTYLVSLVAVFSVVMSLPVLGQGRGRGRGAGGQGMAEGNPLEGMVVEQFAGSVEAINIGSGGLNPSITVGDQLVILAPSYYLESIGLKIEPNTIVSGEGFSDAANPGALVAIFLEVGGQDFQLRNSETGQPLWAGPRGQSGGRGRMGARARTGSGQMMGRYVGQASEGPQCKGKCDGTGPLITQADVKTVSGEIVGDPNIGSRPSSFVLQVEGGKQLTIRTGPNRYWADQDFGLQTGDLVTIQAFACPESEEGAYVPVSITRGTRTLMLRDETGKPLWQSSSGRGGGRGTGTCQRLSADPTN